MLKVRSVCVDTLNSIQSNQYMTDSKKPGFDQWKDYGNDIYTFILNLQDLGFELIFILGEPGMGKSSGQRTLEHDTNIWYNTDNKNPRWTGGREEYGMKVNPRKPFHIIPKTYDDIIDHIKVGMEKGLFEDERYAFITAHTESFKVGNDNRERLKTMGKVATKFQLEGKAETVLYAKAQVKGGKTEYLLETMTDGYNSARSPQDMFEPKIPNDFNFILKKLMGVPVGEPVK